MSAAIPIIRPTSCPSVAELGDKANAWAIVDAVNGRRFLARVVDDGDPDGVILRDPFDFFSKRELAGDPKAPRVGMARQIFPVEHTDADEILVRIAVVLPLCKLSPKSLESIRGDLISAWEGREHLRKHGGRLEIAGAETRIEGA